MRDGDPPPASLALLAGLALVEALGGISIATMLKWPNDVLLGDAKLAGILLERSGERVVAGFGINLAAAPAIEGRKTASLDGMISPEAFAPLLAGAFGRLLAEWRRSGTDWLVEAWEAAATPRGTPISVHSGPDEKIEGRYDGIEPDGALRLVVGDGRVEIVRAGDVNIA